MPVVGNHIREEKVLTPKRIARAVVLTHERPGYLTRTLFSLREASPHLDIVVYDDGSQSPEKMAELEFIESQGVEILFGPHRGLVRTWVKIFHLLGEADFLDDDGIVLLEDDLLFEQGWDDMLLSMASGVEDLGLKPGAMSCLRCHAMPQTKIRDLHGVRAYQTMQHGFQVNMVPAFVFQHADLFEKAAEMSEKGRHGIDVWFLGYLSHYLGLTNMMACRSMVAHMGVGASIAGKQGYQSFNGIGYGLSVELQEKAENELRNRR